jgi:diguanylate cyclase (GGDEF)-like protein
MTTLAFEKDLPDALKRADNLPSPPAVALEVLQLTQNDDSTIEELAACLSRDPALAAKILKLSNSSLFNVGQEITSLEHATMLLGFKTVKLMSLSFSLVEAIPTEGGEVGFDFEEYWRRSLVRSVASRSLSRLLDSGFGDEAFLCGLLAHFGRLALARVMPEEYAQLAQESGGWPSLALEESRLGFTNTDVCAALLKSWNVPRAIYMGTGFWSRPHELPADGSGDDLREFVEFLRMTAWVEAILCEEDKAEPLRNLQQQLTEEHGVSAAELDAFLIGLETGITETANMLSIKLPDGTSHAALVEAAREQIVHVSLGTAAALHEANQARERLASEKQELLERATTDRLTDLPNRAFFDDYLETQIAQRLREKTPLALGLILLDVDHFKKFNDTYGHAAGDEVLRELGQILKETTRKGDVVARYGGEEFALVAPHTNPFNLRTMAERLREAIATATVEFEGHELQITASCGGACIAEFESTRDAHSLIKLADTFLYRAKENGRNRSEVYKKVKFPGR